jgi:hypothetical protein
MDRSSDNDKEIEETRCSKVLISHEKPQRIGSSNSHTFLTENQFPEDEDNARPVMSSLLDRILKKSLLIIQEDPDFSTKPDRDFNSPLGKWQHEGDGPYEPVTVINQTDQIGQEKTLETPRSIFGHSDTRIQEMEDRILDSRDREIIRLQQF